MKVLLLSRKEVEKTASMVEIMQAVEDVFRAKGLGRVQMPPKIYVTFPRGDFRTMPCYVPELGFGGVKVVNVHPLNPKKYGLPTVMASIILIDPETGRPVAIMDGTWITDMRTGAGGGIAAKYLARRNSKILGLVGAGAQARTQLLALREVFNIEEVRVWSESVERSKEFKSWAERLGVNIHSKESVEQAVRGCDIVVTTTPSTEPIVRKEWVAEGVHINAIGADAPGKEELDPEILRGAKIVVDDYEQAWHSGEINVPASKGMIKRSDIYAELGEVVAGKKAGRLSDSEITIFDSTGLAIQDLATAVLVYRRARELGLGTEVELV
ncbi:MAG: alanine dehydrogenase [Candidatus Hadarchaeales archaeon]